MRILKLTGATILTLLFGAALPASAQHDHKGGKQHDAAVQPSHESGKQHDKPAQEAREHGKHAEKHEKHAEKHEQHAEKHEQHAAKSGHEHHPEHSEKQSREWQEHHGWREHGGWGEHGSWREHRSERWEFEHRTWAQRGGYGGFFIPHDRFVLYFGPRHFFRISRPVIYMGYPRFVYRETSFIFVDPYPAAWGDAWYDSDDVYVDYTDGYYLYNRRHPGVSIAINIVN